MLLLILLYKDVMTKLSNRTSLLHDLNHIAGSCEKTIKKTLCCKRNGCITARSTRLDIEINLSPVFVRFDFGMASCI